MRRAGLILALLLVQGVSLAAGAVDIEVGDRRINLPLPEGFVELTPGMSPYYEAMRAYIAPQNVRYLTLITTEVAQALLRGEHVELGRYIYVESEKGASTASISRAHFEEFRALMREQVEQAFASAREQLPEIIGKGNATVSEQFNAEIAVELGGMVSLPIHVDTDNAIANSTIITVEAAVDGEKDGPRVLAGTNLFLHVKDKLLFLYVYGAEGDLEWTRQMASSWAGAIVAANALSSAEKDAVEKSAPFGIDWNSVLERALIGALMGGLIALLALMFRKYRPGTRK